MRADRCTVPNLERSNNGRQTPLAFVYVLEGRYKDALIGVSLVLHFWFYGSTLWIQINLVLLFTRRQEDITLQFREYSSVTLPGCNNDVRWRQRTMYSLSTDKRYMYQITNLKQERTLWVQMKKRVLYTEGRILVKRGNAGLFVNGTYVKSFLT